MKPCPFCGSSRVEAIECDEDYTHYVECENCQARGPSEKGPDRCSNKAAATIAWDERVEQGK